MTKLSEKTGGGLIYKPPMMQFDGSTGYYSKTSVTTAGNNIFLLVEFAISSFTGDVVQYLIRANGPTHVRAAVLAVSSNYSSLANRRDKLQFFVTNSAGTNICVLISPSGYLDGERHVLFAKFNATTGAASFVIDGVDVDDTGNADRVAPTTGTLDTGAGSFYVGAAPAGASKVTGNLGFCAHGETDTPVWSDFMDQYGNPKPIDFSGWLFGHFAGKMDENEGTAGAMTKNGTITLVDPGQAPHIGLPTIGTAEAWHLKTGKIAWVDGVEKVGTGYFPAAMDFSGGGYYTDTYTSTGNKVVCVVCFKRSAFTGGTLERLCRSRNSGATQRFLITIASSDHATTTRRSKLSFTVNNSAGTEVCNLVSDIAVVDGLWHTVYCEFDGDAGTAKLWIDGVDANDIGNAEYIAPTTATMASGANSTFYVGSLTGAANAYGGQLRFLGHRDAAGLTVSDFTQTDGSPKNIESTLSTVWGATPLYWNEHGDMVNNLGSAGAMTANGTITVAAASSWS